MLIPLNERKLRDEYLKSVIASTVKSYIGKESNETILNQVIGLYKISFEDIEYLSSLPRLNINEKSFINGLKSIIEEGVESYINKNGYSLRVAGKQMDFSDITEAMESEAYKIAVEEINEEMSGTDLSGIEPTDETDPVGGSVGSVIKAMLDDLKNRTAQDVAQTTQSILNLQKEQQEKEKEEMNIDDQGDVLDEGEDFDADIDNLELDGEDKKKDEETDKELTDDVEKMEKELEKTNKKDSKKENKQEDNLEEDKTEEGKDDNPFKALESVESSNDVLKANLEQVLKNEVENFKSVKGIIGVLFDMFGSGHGSRLMKHIRYTHNNQADYNDLHNPKSDKIFIDKSKKGEFIQLLTKTSKEIISSLEKDDWFKTLKKYNLVKYSNKFNEKEDEFEIAVIDYNNLEKYGLDQLKKFYSSIMSDLGLEPGDNLDTITDKEYMLDITYTELSCVINSIESTISGEIQDKSYIRFMSYWKNNQCKLTLTLEDIAFESIDNSFLSEEELYEMTAGFVNGFENVEMRFDDVLTEIEKEHSYSPATEAIEDGYIKHSVKSYAGGVVTGMLLKYLHLTFSPKEFKVNTIDLDKSQYMEEKRNIVDKINSDKAELEAKLEKLPLIKFLIECGVLKLFPESKVDEYSPYVVLGVKENANISFDKKSMTIRCNDKELSMKELGLLDRVLTKDSSDEGNMVKNYFMRSFGETLGKNFERAGNEIRKFLKEKGLNKSKLYAGVGAYKKYSGWSGVAVFFNKLSIKSYNDSEEGTEGIKEALHSIKSVFTPSELRSKNKSISTKEIQDILVDQYNILSQAYKDMMKDLKSNKLVKSCLPELDLKLVSKDEALSTSVRPTKTNPNHIGTTVIHHGQPYQLDVDNVDEVADEFYEVAKKAVEKYNKSKYRIGYDDYGIGLDTKDTYILVDTPSAESYFEDNVSLESIIFDIIRNNNTLTHTVLESVEKSLENQFYSEYVNPGIVTKLATESIFIKDNSLHIPLMIVDKSLIDTSKEFITYALKTGLQNSKDLVANIFNKVDYRYAIESVGDNLIVASAIIDNFNKDKYESTKLGFESYQNEIIEKDRCKVALENFDRMISSLDDMGLESTEPVLNQEIIYKGICAKMRLNKVPKIAAESITQYIMKDDMIGVESLESTINTASEAMENFKDRLHKEYDVMSYGEFKKIYDEIGQRALDLAHQGVESVTNVRYDEKLGIIFTMSQGLRPSLESVDRVNNAVGGLESLNKVITSVNNGNLEVVIPINLGVKSCEGFANLGKAIRNYKEYKDFNKTKDIREIAIESITGEIIKPFFNLNSDQHLMNCALAIVDNGFESKLEEAYKRYGVESSEYKTLATKYQTTVKMVYESLVYTGVLLGRLGLESSMNFINLLSTENN